MIIPDEIEKRERGEKIKIIQEIWVPCFFDSRYSVSNLGLVKKNNKYCSIRQYDDRWGIREGQLVKVPGYFKVCIAGKDKKLHQVIYYSFFPEEYIFNNKEKAVDHINGVKEDCRLINLRLIPWDCNTKKGRKDDSEGMF